MNFDWKSLVKTVAPAIASVFGTPLAGMGVSALLDAILPAGEARPDDPDKYLSQILATANPEMLLKIKLAEQQFLMDMKKLDIDLEKYVAQMAQANTESARTMKMAWLKTDKWDYEPALALGVCAAFGYAEYWIFAHATSATAMDAGTSVLIGRILGSVDAAFMLLLSFRWGTSAGSERKTEIAAQQQAAATVHQNTNK